MRCILLFFAATFLTACGTARAQSAVELDLSLTRATMEARPALQSLSGAQGIVQELLLVADTTVGTKYFSFPQPGSGDFSGIDGVGVRLTPSFDGQIKYVVYILNGGDNPKGPGKLRITLTETVNENDWIMPVNPIDSVDVDFETMKAADLNYVVTLDDPDWQVRKGEDFFITFEAIPESDTSSIEFIVDSGSTDESDDRYFPARTVLYGDFDPPDDGWRYRFTARNNLVAGVAVANLLEPSLLAPADSAEGLDDEVKLLWNAEPRADHYRVQVTTDRRFENITLEYTTADTTKMLDGIAPSTRYWWWVRAENDLGESPWSQARSFTTSATASAEGPLAHEIPKLDVFPNPAPDRAYINLHIPRTAAARVQIFDALGRRIDVIYNGILTSGSHALEWQTALRAPGLYFIRLQLAEHSLVRALLIP